MQNWTQLVRERIQASRLEIADRESIISELAAHLEEIYEDARSRGLSDTAALEHSLQEVNDWRVLGLDILRAKQEDSMNHRTKSLWLPSLITLLGASLSLMALQSLGIQPHLVWVRHVAVLIYWAWLTTLPVFGALGAYLSQRTQGTTPARLVAGLSPALVMLIVMCLILAAWCSTVSTSSDWSPLGRP